MTAAYQDGQGEPEYEYGFYDSEDDSKTCYWYVFGILAHETAESAMHTARKNCWGQPVIVRRVKGKTEWEEVQS